MGSSTNQELKSFREVTGKVIDRAVEMQLAAENSKEALIKLLSRHEARVTGDIVIDFIVASLKLNSKRLKGESELIHKLRNQLILTNDLIASYTQNNPHLLQSFTNVENIVLNALLNLPKMPRLVSAGFILLTPTLRSPMFAAFEQLRIALTGGKSSDTLNSRKTVVTFMRSLYDKKSPHLNSYPRIINFVRKCSDIHNPHYNEFVQIRSLVHEWASTTLDGEDKVWRSLAQELKPSHRK